MRPAKNRSKNGNASSVAKTAQKTRKAGRNAGYAEQQKDAEARLDARNQERVAQWEEDNFTEVKFSDHIMKLNVTPKETTDYCLK